MQFLWDLIVIIGLPWVVRLILSFLFSDKSKNQTTSQDEALQQQFTAVPHHRRQWTQAILLSTLIYCCYYGFYAPSQNIFEKLDLPSGAPNFLIRNQLRAYLEENPHLNEPQSGIVIPRMGKINTNTDNIYQNDDEDGVFSVADQMMAIYELIKSSGNRFSYLTFGEDAFIYCRWCRSDYEYMLYMLPSVLMQYLTFMAVVLLVTELIPGKRSIRPWIFTIIGSTLMSEIGAYLLPQEYMVELFAEKFPATHSWLQFFRYAEFVLFTVLLWVYENKSITDKHLFQSIMSEQERTYGRLKLLQLQQMAILSDSDLLKQHALFHQHSYGSAESMDTSDTSAAAASSLRFRPAVSKESIQKL